MQNPKNSGSDDTLNGPHRNHVTLVQMFRSMVAMIGTETDDISTFPVNGISEHVLLDVDVDGHRYILLKMNHMDRSVSSLSPREHEIVRMVARGHPNKVIAAVLNISTWTVCTHLRRVFAKLDVTSRAAMVAKLADLSGVIDLKAADAGTSPRQRVVSTEHIHAGPELAPSAGFTMRGAKNSYPPRAARK